MLFSQVQKPLAASLDAAHIDVYSIPEFISDPVTVSSQALAETIVSPAPDSVHSVTGATSKADGTDVYTGGRGTVQ